LQAHAGGSLKNIGGERAAVDVEFDAQIAGIANPGDLIAGIEDHYFGKYTNENGAFGHVESLQSFESYVGTLSGAAAERQSGSGRGTAAQLGGRPDGSEFYDRDELRVI